MRHLDRSSSNGRYSNPCLTMHQPWASLLVHGIKRVEGRSWPSPITGRLWIHAASKVPDPDTIRAMEDFYREIYAVNGITDIKFPKHYPVSRLLGCVEVVGCVRSQELVCWENVPESVRLEGLTDFCWLSENPQRLVVPFEMRGYQGVYNLERRIYDGAVRGLSPVQGPQPVKFPLPDPRDPFSLKPGSLTSDPSKSAVQETASVTAAIAGARAAATQFSRKDHNAATSSQTQQFRGNRVDSSSGYGSLSSISQGSPSSIAHDSPPYLQNRNQPFISQGSPSYLQKQNRPSISQNSLFFIAQGSPSYPQNHNQPSISQNSCSTIAQGSSSYPQNQNQPSVSQNSRFSIAQGSPPYLQNQSQPSISQDSRSSIAQGGPSYLQNQNQPSISQSTPAYLRNLGTEPRRSPRLQNGAPNRLVAVALRELKLSSDSEREGQSPVQRSWPRQNP